MTRSDDQNHSASEQSRPVKEAGGWAFAFVFGMIWAVIAIIASFMVKSENQLTVSAIVGRGIGTTVLVWLTYGWLLSLAPAKESTAKEREFYRLSACIVCFVIHLVIVLFVNGPSGLANPVSGLENTLKSMIHNLSQ